MILLGILAGLTIGLLLGGRLAALRYLRFRYAGLILAALVIRYGTQALIVRGFAPAEELRLPLLAGAFAVLAGALWLNRSIPGILLVLAGVLGNALAIVVNDGRMPAWGPALDAVGIPVAELAAGWQVLLPAGVDLAFLLQAGPLGDVIPVPLGPLTNVVSIGDVAIATGLGWLLVDALRRTGEERDGGVSLWSGSPPATDLQPRPLILGGGRGPGLAAPVAAHGTSGTATGGTAPAGRSIGGRIRAHPYLRLAGDARFSAFWLAQTIGVFGDRLNQVALGVLVIGLTGSPVLSALVFVSAMLPNLLLGPIAGTFVDRWDHRRTMIAADLIRGGLVLLIPVAASVELWLVYPLVFLVTTVSCFFRPARAAAVPRIVREEDLLAANGALWTGETIAEIAGYPIAGALIAFLGANVALAFWLDAATYLASALLLLGIAIPPVVRVAAPRTQRLVAGVIADLREGWRFLRASPPLFQNTIVSTVGQLSVGATLALTPAYVFLLIGAPAPVDGAVPGLAETLGLLEAVLGLGNLVGGFVVGAIGSRLGRGRLVIVGFALMGLSTIVLGLAGEVALALAASFLVGLFNLVWLVPSQTLFGELVPGTLMGRVVAIRSSIVFGAMTGAAAVSSLAAGVVPPGTIFAILGAVTLVAGLAGALLPAVRDAGAPRAA